MNSFKANCRSFFIITFICILVINCNSAYCKSECSIILSNPLNKARIDESIVLERNSIEKKLGVIGDNFTVLVKNEKGENIASQTDDLNGDGKWDELAFIVSFQPKEKVVVGLVLTEKSAMPVYIRRANVHLGVSRERNSVFVETKEEERPKDHIAQSVPFLYQYEGPGWENDKLAFRTYFDSRNGKDVFGKLIPDMVLDSIGLPGKSYHELSRWGMDVLKVGQSLGIGAIAVTDGDSLYRLGATESAHYKLIADGSVRAIFQLSYKGWKVKNQSLNFEEQITIWGGKYYFSSKASLSGDTKNFSLVTGITTLHLIDENYVPEFVQTPDNHVFIAVNNVLSENKDFLATGLMANNVDFKNWKRSPETGVNDEIIKTAYVTLNSENNKTVEYFIFAGWEQSDVRFKTEKLLNTIMTEEAEKLNHDIIIKF